MGYLHELVRCTPKIRYRMIERTLVEKDAFNGTLARKRTLWLKKLQLQLGQDGRIPGDVAERDFWRDESLATTKLVAKDSAQEH